jgi:hypothetical protein
VPAPAVNTIKHRRQSLVGVRNSVSLPVISKKERFKALFVSRFSPDVAVDVAEKPLKEKLSPKKLVCTKHKTKPNTYASFHGLLTEDSFNLSGSLVFGLQVPNCSFLWQTQVYSSTPTTGDTVLSSVVLVGSVEPWFLPVMVQIPGNFDIFLSKYQGTWNQNVVGSRTVFTFLITKFTSKWHDL